EPRHRVPQIEKLYRDQVFHRRRGPVQVLCQRAGKDLRVDERLCLLPESRPAVGCRPPYSYASKPLSARYSAICTALVAAPFLRLSLTTHMFSVFGCVSSRRKRPTNTSSL